MADSVRWGHLLQTFTLLLFYLATMFTFFASFILEFPTFNIPSIVGEILRYVFMLLPTYNIAKGLLDVGAAPTCEHVPAYGKGCVSAGEYSLPSHLLTPRWSAIVVWCGPQSSVWLPVHLAGTMQAKSWRTWRLQYRCG